MNASDTPLLEILHTDPGFVVVNKRSGMLSVPGRGPEKIDSVTHRVKQMFPGCIEQPAVHRLDMDTAGLMVVARKADAHRQLSQQFQNRLTKKKYIAVLDGELPASHGSSGTLELPFRLDIDNRPIQIYDEVHGKIGITHWRVLERGDGRTRIEFIPITGRTHQLRVHSAHPKGLGLAIVGDPFYGDGVGPGNLLLHACELSFQHPETGQPLNFQSPPRF